MILFPRNPFIQGLYLLQGSDVLGGQGNSDPVDLCLLLNGLTILHKQKLMFFPGNKEECNNRTNSIPLPFVRKRQRLIDTNRICKEKIEHLKIIHMKIKS